MLDYAGDVDVSAKPHQQRLLRPPTRGVRDWRTEMSPRTTPPSNGMAGDLLAELGYESRARRGRQLRGRPPRPWYRLRITAWNAAAYATQRSPLWRRRHRRLSSATPARAGCSRPRKATRIPFSEK